MLPCIVWPQRILDGIAKFEWDVRWSALAAAVVLFLPASLAMGMVTPFAVRIGIRQMEAAGTVSGGYSALSTAGSIAGTLAATFLLIPAFPVGTLLVGLAVTLLACAVVLARDRPSAVIAVLSAAAVAAAIAGRFTPAPVGGEKVLFRKDTPYHHLVVTQLDSSRWLRFDTLVQSGVDISPTESVDHRLRRGPARGARVSTRHPPRLRDRPGRGIISPGVRAPAARCRDRHGRDRSGRPGRGAKVLPLPGVRPRADRHRGRPRLPPRVPARPTI